MGVVTVMAIVITYYIPERFRKKSANCVPPVQYGKVLEFRVPEKKPA
jgi:hypothetical protein